MSLFTVNISMIFTCQQKQKHFVFVVYKQQNRFSLYTAHIEGLLLTHLEGFHCRDHIGDVLAPGLSIFTFSSPF